MTAGMNFGTRINTSFILKAIRDYQLDACDKEPSADASAPVEAKFRRWGGMCTI